MKKLFTLAALALLIIISAGCKKDQTQVKELSVEGCWELTDVQTKSASIGGVEVNVYLEFTKETFTIYQLLGEGHYRRYAGTYTLADGILDGIYDSGDPLGSSYKVTQAGDVLTLATAGGHETDSYRKITSIPSSVVSDVLE